VIAVAAQKGGVGKTTTTVSLASALARFHGKKVLIVDLDPQSHVNIALRDQVQAGGGALSDVMADMNGLEVEEITTNGGIEGLFITPADPGLLQTEDRLSARIGKELVLKKALEITRTHYDVILLDCPPNVGALTVNALVAADHVMIPCHATALAMAGASGLLNIVREVQDHLNTDLDIMGVVLTRIDGRNAKTNEAVQNLLEETWGDLLMPVQIGVSNSLAKAQLAGQDIFAFDPQSRGASQYKALADEVVQIVPGLSEG
jgi:chromosome partitioning protein